MRRLHIMAVAVGFALGIGALYAAAPGQDFCGTWVERNKTCGDDLLSVCISTVRQKMLEQIQTLPAESQAEMKAAIETKLAQLCPQMISQVTGANALSECEKRMTASDPKSMEQLKKVKECLKKSPCADYAACALTVK
jgi:hypothetical protein